VLFRSAAQAPKLLHEIGLARERTFRAVGEGTGRDLDLDAFDARYRHLCVWDERAQRLAGAYRMIEVDSSSAASTLYTSTLFEYGRPLVAALSPGLELGRAFVVPEYQKQYAPLMLLWSGIGRYAARHARVDRLFGAVSIPATYSAAARDAIVASLSRHAVEPRLARFVAPKHPIAEPRLEPHAVADLRSLNETIVALDREGKGLPVLLRQYLKLNARALAFSVDPAFGHVVDALMVVDLARAPEQMLHRYMGRDDARAFMARVAAGSASRPYQIEPVYQIEPALPGRAAAAGAW